MEIPNPVVTSIFLDLLVVDTDHARDKVTCCSVTWIILLLNNTLIVWLSKQQKTVETLTYTSELKAAQIAVDLLVEMRHKLRMLGVVLEDASSLVGDNMAVVKNTSIPESVLAKKHNAINYHKIREAVAAGIIRIGKEDTETNIADAFTKLMDFSRKFKLLRPFMWER